MGLFSKIKEGLKKTRKAVMGQIDSMLKSFTKIDEEQRCFPAARSLIFQLHRQLSL